MTGVEREIFSLLNLDTAGMEQVKIAVEAGNLDAAGAAYLDYYRNRQAPVLPWASIGENDLASRTSGYDFLNDPPLGFTWRDRDRVKEHIHTGKGYIAARSAAGSLSPYTVVDLADLLLEHKVFIPYHHADGAVDLGADWDWEAAPPIEGQRWPMSLCYQYFLKTLAVSFWLTDDEKYIDKLVWIYRHYFNCVNDRSDWMWVPDMQLARNYQQLLPFILSWENLPAADLCALTHWLGTTCAECMETVEGAPGNQLLFNGIGLLWLGVGLHEFERSPAWREKGLDRCGGYFAPEGAFYPDGSARENSLGYTVSSSNSGLEVLLLVNKNGWSCSPHIEKAMIKRARFLADMRRPDGLCPQTGDGQQGKPDIYLSSMIDLGADPSLEHVVSTGERGPRPDHESSYYPWMGTCVMRSDWGRDANFLMCDMGPLGDIHAHEAKLAIEVAVFGRTLIADKGVHTYSRQERHHRWYRFLGGTRGHSTVTVDGLCQMRLVSARAKSVSEPLDNKWHSSAVCDCLNGEYDEGWGPVQFTEPMRTGSPPPPFGGEIDVWVTHRRTVIYVKATGADDFDYWLVSDRLSGSGEHVYEQLFHFVPVETALDEASQTVRTTTAGEANLALVPVRSEGLEVEIAEGADDGGEGVQGWHVEGGEILPAPCAIFRRSGTDSTLMQTVLWPLRPGDDRPITVEPLGDAQGGWLRVLLPSGGEDIICAAAQSGSQVLGDESDRPISFDGSAAVVRLDGSSTLRVWDVVDGAALSYDGKTLS